MTRVNTVGSDDNRALSVVGQSLIGGALASGVDYLVRDQRLHMLSKDTFDFASRTGRKIEEAITDPELYKTLKNNLSVCINNLANFEQPIKDSKAHHKDISASINEMIKQMQAAGASKTAIAQAIAQKKSEAGAAMSKTTVATEVKKLGSTEHALLQQNIKNAQLDIKNYSLGVARKINSRAAMIFGGTVASILAIVLFINDAKKEKAQKR